MFFPGFFRRPILAVCVLPWLVTGCGSSGPRVVKVTGTVTHGGKPVPKLFLHFEPQHGRPSWGVTDKDGRYSLHYEKDRDGAETGTHKVWVDVRAAHPGEEAELNTLKRQPPMRSILQKYGKYETTPKTVEVSEDNQVIDLALD
jgi:hypothetical protein